MCSACGIFRKIRCSFLKKFACPYGPEIASLLVFFEGGLRKCGRKRWCFCGEVVVDCVVNVVRLTAVSQGKKYANFSKIILRISPSLCG